MDRTTTTRAETRPRPTAAAGAAAGRTTPAPQSPPAPHAPHAAPAVLRERAARVLAANWTGGSTVPSRELYPHQWSWDSAFIAIGLRHLSPLRAQLELETLLSAQWADGRLPHIVFNPSVPLDAYFPSPDFWRSTTAGRAAGAPGTVQTSGIVQPPVHALAAWLVHLADPALSRARAFLPRLHPRLAAWHRFLLHHRDLGGAGLAAVVHPWEQGMDNSPCWDAPLSRVSPARPRTFRRADLDHGSPQDRPTDLDYGRYVRLAADYRDAGYGAGAAAGMAAGRGGTAAAAGLATGGFAVEDPSFNALLIASEHALARITGELGVPATARHERAERLTRVLVERLWDPADGIFRCRDLLAGGLEGASGGDGAAREGVAGRTVSPGGAPTTRRTDTTEQAGPGGGTAPTGQADRTGQARPSHWASAAGQRNSTGGAPTPRRADGTERAGPSSGIPAAGQAHETRQAGPGGGTPPAGQAGRTEQAGPSGRTPTAGRADGADRAGGGGGAGGALIGEVGVTGLVPLVLPGLPRDIAAALVRTACGPRFELGGRARLVPSHDLLSPAFDPQRYWRGPAWFNTNWLLERGLRLHGERERADVLRAAVLDTAVASDFAEYVDPYTGSGCGARGFSWSAALALDMSVDMGVDMNVNVTAGAERDEGARDE
ncbi:MGH1-like glycoside hydrolase domain-containing protein [Streptomyces lasiicapitis]|uniref:MGH1-like glycoside hydrolase domain-containing protein n=1 Tax=Streptomyces lasiicapitis TaxID=1923961 RepID=UPI00364D6B50